MSERRNRDSAPWLVLGLTMAAAMTVWWLSPGSALDRTLFTWVARGFYNPPVQIAPGPDRGWLLSFADGRNARRDPFVSISLGDDPQGIFQESPQSPVDLAVVFSNIHRLGARHAASAVVLAWDDPDAVGIAALEQSMDAFDSITTCAPVTRGAVPQPMPPAFRRSSLDASTVAGGGGLPVVNRLPVLDVFLGGNRSFAGFQRIESEPDDGRHLLAIWGDRVIPSFALVVAMQQAGVQPSELVVRLGKSIRLGADGPLIPIDGAGRLDPRVASPPSFQRIAAEELIDRRELIVETTDARAVVLYDDRSIAEPATRRFSEQLSGTLGAILATCEPMRAKPYPASGIAIDWLLLGALCLGLAAGSTSRSSFAGGVSLLVVSAGWAALVICAFALLDCWLPASAGISAITVALAYRTVFTRRGPS